MLIAVSKNNYTIKSQFVLLVTTTLPAVFTYSRSVAQLVHRELQLQQRQFHHDFNLGPTYILWKGPSTRGYMKQSGTFLWKINLISRWFQSGWTEMYNWYLLHGDVVKWKHFLRYWPFVRGINRSPVNSPHKGQWRGALIFSLICAWMNGWVNNSETGDWRHHCAHYDVTAMCVVISHFDKVLFNVTFINLKTNGTIINYCNLSSLGRASDIWKEIGSILSL